MNAIMSHSSYKIIFRFCISRLHVGGILGKILKVYIRSCSIAHFAVHVHILLCNNKQNDTAAAERGRGARQTKKQRQFHITVKNRRPSAAIFPCIYAASHRHNSTEQLFCGIWQRPRNSLLNARLHLGGNPASFTFSHRMNSGGYLP